MANGVKTIDGCVRHESLNAPRYFADSFLTIWSNANPTTPVDSLELSISI